MFHPALTKRIYLSLQVLSRTSDTAASPRSGSEHSGEAQGRVKNDHGKAESPGPHTDMSRLYGDLFEGAQHER